MRYLIAIDLDGTTLNSQKEISARTRLAVARAIQEGHVVVIATGRSPADSRQYWKELGLSTPIINLNGALVHHFDMPGLIIQHLPIDGNVARQMIRDAEQYQLMNVMVEVLNEFYLLKDDELKYLFGNDHQAKFIGPLDQQDWDAPSSLLIRVEKSAANDFVHHLNSAYGNNVFSRAWSGPMGIVEVLRRDVSKAAGLNKLIELYQIPREHVIAFGDAENDMEMIAWAGYGIAMGNAIPELKRIADQVTATNDQNGVALVLERLLLRQFG